MAYQEKGCMHMEPKKASDIRLFSRESERYSLEHLRIVVRQVARMYARSPDHADDLTQECVVRICSNLSKCDSPAALEAWVRKVTHNHCRTLRRRDSFDESRRISLDEFREIPDPERSPDHAFEARCRRVAVDSAVDGLPEREGAAVRFVCLEGLTYREAAAFMNVRAESVRRAVARGMAKLGRAADLVLWTDRGAPSAVGVASGARPVLALEPNRIARDRLADGMRLGSTGRLLDGMRFASGWRELDALARRLPGCPVVVDPECPGRDRRGVDALRSLRAHNPDCPVIGYGRAGASWQSGRLAREIGFAAVVSIGVDDDAPALRHALLRAADCEETEELLRRVRKRTDPKTHPFLDVLLHESVTRRTVTCVARTLGVGARTLRNLCRVNHLPTPKQLMLLVGVFHVERLARWSGHARGSVALAVGLRGLGDYRRMVRRLFDATPSDIAARGGPEYVADVIVREVADGRGRGGGGPREFRDTASKTPRPEPCRAQSRRRVRG